MGGLGSGRPSGGGKSTTEICRSLDVNRLNKSGVFSLNWSGGWHWVRGTERIASISMRGGRDLITLSYRWRANDADWHAVEEPVSIRWKDCRYGGCRPYFACPGVINGMICAREVVKLYCAGRYYLCRHCHRLTYASRKEDRYDLALRKANKVRRRLGGEPRTSSTWPTRPKGMWHRTYSRLSKSISDAENTADERLALLAARLLDFNKSATSRTGSGKKGKFWR